MKRQSGLFSPSMLRSLRAISVVMLLIFGSAPVLFAASSACAMTPCCTGSKVATFAPADRCCEVSMCAQELPPVTSTKATTVAKISADISVTDVPELLSSVLSFEARPLGDSPPLPTRDRLALLSTLLI